MSADEETRRADEKTRRAGEQATGGQATGEPTTDEPPRPTSSAARAASRARRIGGGARPAPEVRSRPSPGSLVERPLDDEPPEVNASDITDASDITGVPDVATATSDATHRPSPGPLRDAPDRSHTTVLRWLGVLVAAVVVATLAAADVLLWHPWHHDQTVAEQRERLAASVNTAVAKVVSYDYRHIDRDAAAAEAYLAEPFKDEYQKSITTTIKASALKLKSVVVGEVASFGIVSVTDDGKQATVLVLGQQSVTNALHPESSPAQDPVSVRVTVQLVDGKWLISKMDLV